MSRIFFILGLLFSVILLKANTFVIVEENIDSEPVSLIYANPANNSNTSDSKNMPQFPGGMEALTKYIEENIKYPEEAKMNKQQGQVIVQFWVQQTGKIEDVKILRGVSKELDTEAVRLISEMPEWIPAEKAGKKMKMMHIYSVNFRLDNVKFPVSESRAENK